MIRMVETKTTTSSLESNYNAVQLREMIMLYARQHTHVKLPELVGVRKRHLAEILTGERSLSSVDALRSKAVNEYREIWIKRLARTKTVGMLQDMCIQAGYKEEDLDLTRRQLASILIGTYEPSDFK